MTDVIKKATKKPTKKEIKDAIKLLTDNDYVVFDENAHNMVPDKDNKDGESEDYDKKWWIYEGNFGLIKKRSETFTEKDFLECEAINAHGINGMMMVYRYGTPAQQVLAERLHMQHLRIGHRLEYPVEECKGMTTEKEVHGVSEAYFQKWLKELESENHISSGGIDRVPGRTKHDHWKLMFKLQKLSMQQDGHKALLEAYETEKFPKSDEENDNEGNK